jgi:hypothetical protein
MNKFQLNQIKSFIQYKTKEKCELYINCNDAIDEFNQIKEFFQDICKKKHELFFNYIGTIYESFFITIDHISDSIDYCPKCGKKSKSFIKISGIIWQNKDFVSKKGFSETFFQYNERLLSSICHEQYYGIIDNCINGCIINRIHIDYEYNRGYRRHPVNISFHDLKMIYKPTLYYLAIKNVSNIIARKTRINHNLYLLKKYLVLDIFKDIKIYLKTFYGINVKY